MSMDDTTHDLKPATPAGRTSPMRVLSSLFRTPTRLVAPTATTTVSRARTSSLSSSPTRSSTPGTPSSRLPAVVLQTYSISTDSIVLTALPTVPFCCHEDLMTMSRAQLEDVVHALNAQLPRRMRIGPEDDFWRSSDRGSRVGECSDEEDGDDGLSRMSEAEMKKRIEELVGIRAVVGKNRVSRSRLGLSMGVRGVPPAPKAVRTRDAAWRPYERNPWDMEVDDAGYQTDDSSIMIEDALAGSSPLASRTKPSLHSRGRIKALSRLASLQEESEGSESKEDDLEDKQTRPSKRQRVLQASTTLDSETGYQIVQARGSRLIENMDISGSPLLAEDGDASSDVASEFDGRTVDTTTSTDGGEKASEQGVQSPLQRRQSARIKAMALKRASSTDSVKQAASDTQHGLKSSILRSKTFTSGRSSRNDPSSKGRSDAEKDSSTPREFTIRLPFTSMSPNEKPDSLVRSAPRILRSRSQRLLSANQSTKKTPLGRSQSERYPRASDLAFVTVDRPRYRFARRKSKGTKVTKEGQESYLSMSAPPVQIACQPRREILTDSKQPNEKYEDEKENDDPQVVTKHIGISSLHTLPSALCGLFTPRSRAPSTSTVASIRDSRGDSPVRTVDKEDNAATTITTTAANGTSTEHVSEAMGRMVVDIVAEGLSKEE